MCVFWKIHLLHRGRGRSIERRCSECKARGLQKGAAAYSRRAERLRAHGDSWVATCSRFNGIWVLGHDDYRASALRIASSARAPLPRSRRHLDASLPSTGPASRKTTRSLGVPGVANEAFSSRSWARSAQACARLFRKRYSAGLHAVSGVGYGGATADVVTTVGGLPGVLFSCCAPTVAASRQVNTKPEHLKHFVTAPPPFKLVSRNPAGNGNVSTVHLSVLL